MLYVGVKMNKLYIYRQSAVLNFHITTLVKYPLVSSGAHGFPLLRGTE